MAKAPIHQLLDTFLEQPEHDIFVLPSVKFEELKQALLPIHRVELEEVGPSNCEYMGKWYPCIAYRQCAFIDAKELLL